MKIVSIKVTAFVHATEDLEKVLVAVRSISPAVTLAVTTKKRAKGHHGNEIMILDYSTKNAKQGEHFLSDVLSRLTTMDRTELLSDLSSRIDTGGTLHIRLDKQEAFKGLIRLQNIDPIKIAISFRREPFDQTDFEDQVRKLLVEIPTNMGLRWNHTLLWKLARSHPGNEEASPSLTKKRMISSATGRPQDANLDL